MNDAMKSYSVVYETPVAWGEMDALGHVNNIIYFRYFESARSEYFRKIGVWDYGLEHGIGVILHSTSCRFRKPLTYPDKVHVGTRVVELMEDRFRMEYKVYSESLDTIAAEGEGMIVSYDYNVNLKCPLPKVIRDAIIDLDNPK